jgi:hypothetical protein
MIVSLICEMQTYIQPKSNAINSTLFTTISLEKRNYWRGRQQWQTPDCQ